MAHDSITSGAELLELLRQRLAARIGQDRYQVWFGSQVEFTYAAGVITIAAPERFSLERLRRTFREDLNAVLREVSQEDVALSFVVQETAPQEHTTPAIKAFPSLRISPEKQNGSTRLPRNGVPDTASSGRRFARLEEFCVGEENCVAFSAASATPLRLGSVSPLFVHGPTGSGKTHLLEGVWTAVRRVHPRAKCVYLSAEQFTTYFLEALQGSGLPSFRRKYREVQLLAIDDVQFFAGKRATLVELLHTIDTLHRTGGQILLSADRPPVELSALGPELEARMSAGLVCELAAPQRATRRAILQRLAQRLEGTINDEVLDLLAERLPGDGRRLAGALNRLEAASQALKSPIDVGLAVRALADLFQAAQRPVDLRDIERAVCEVFGVESPDLHSARKSKPVAQPRMLAMWLARKHTRAALQDIGRYFGRKSHSTVISAEKAVSTWIEDGAVLHLPHGACQVNEAIRRIEARLSVG